MNSTPSALSSRELAIACSAVQAQLASTRKTAAVCRRNSRTIARSSGVPSLIL